MPPGLQHGSLQCGNQTIDVLMERHHFAFMNLGLSVAIMYITPEVAAFILSNGEEFKNRKTDERTVDRYADYMVRDQWKLTHQGLSFDVRHLNQDGRHRLNAIVESGKPQFIFVFENMPIDNFDKMDNGRLRTGADIISISEKGDPSDQLNGLYNGITLLLVRYARYQKTMGLLSIVGNKSNLNVSNADIDLTYNSNEQEIKEAAKLAVYVHAKFRYLPRPAIGFYYLLLKRNIPSLYHIYIDSFFEKLVTADNLPAGHPVYQLIELYKDELRKKNKSKKILKLKHREFIKAWNIYVGTDKRTKITFGEMELRNEKSESVEFSYEIKTEDNPHLHALVEQQTEVA